MVRPTTLLIVISCILVLFFLDTTLVKVHAFGGGDDLDEFQPNPFLSPEERERSIKKQQKLEANKLIDTPRPTPPRNGPAADYKFDQELPLTVGDLVPINQKIRSSLDTLVRTAYFRYYKVNLHSECPYWAMNRMCTSGGGCNVCECTENEIPKPWRIESTDPVAPTAEQDVLPGASSHDKEKVLKDWSVEVWSDAEKEQGDKTATYVNLLENVEGNTGYSGEEPRRIWDAIYNENCFARIGHSNVSDMCFEDRLMYRLISGLHSSISAHVFKNWKLDEKWSYMPNQFLWNILFTTQEQNMSEAELEGLRNAKVGSPEADKLRTILESDKKVLERINNLFFTLEMLLESVATLADTDIFAYSDNLSDDQKSKSIVINTGDFEQDSHTAKLLRELIQTAHSRSDLYTTQTSEDIKTALIPPPTMHGTFATLDEAHIANMRHLFHNVSIIMNCVGCEKCRIWSKLNILGLSTGLKLAASQSMKNTQITVSKLQRNEIIALINTLNSFSEAVHFVSSLSKITAPVSKPPVTNTPPKPSVAPVTTETNAEKKTEKKTTKNTSAGGNGNSRDGLDPGQKLLVIVMGLITISIVFWRYSVASPDTFSTMDKKRDSTQPRKIPALQEERIKREQANLQMAQALLGNNQNTIINNNNTAKPQSSGKSRKVD